MPQSDSPLDPTAIILAGGMGVRLKSVVDDRSKVVADVSGKPFLTFVLDQVAAAGISTAVLCTGHLREHLRATIGETYSGLHVLYSEEETPLGTGGAVRQALDFVSGNDVLVLNGDSYCDVDLRETFNYHIHGNIKATMVVAYQEDRSRFGGVTIDDAGIITHFLEKQQDSVAGWINAGIYVFARSVIESIPAGMRVSLERDLFPKLAGVHLNSMKSQGRFIDIGTPESYASAQSFFEKKSL